MYSCSVLTHSVRGKEITTIEGLAGPNGELHPVQQAFVDELGPQCGFCTPGQIISAYALLKENPNPAVKKQRKPSLATCAAAVPTSIISTPSCGRRSTGGGDPLWLTSGCTSGRTFFPPTLWPR